MNIKKIFSVYIYVCVDIYLCSDVNDKAEAEQQHAACFEMENEDCCLLNSFRTPLDNFSQA